MSTTTEGPSYERSVTVVQTPVTTWGPPAAGVAVEHPVAVVSPTISARTRSSYSSRFAPDAIIAALVGLVALVVGLIAITRAGFDGPMSDPVVEVLGFTHTTTLGLIEIGIGLCLLISAAARSRGAELFFGAVLGVGGFVGAVQTESFKKSLALESSMAWGAVIAGAVVVLAALILPSYVTRSTTVENV